MTDILSPRPNVDGFAVHWRRSTGSGIVRIPDPISGGTMAAIFHERDAALRCVALLENANLRLDVTYNVQPYYNV